MKKREQRKLAARLIMNGMGEVHHVLDCAYYKGLLSGEKETVKFYIHLYAIIIGLLLRYKYEPH